MRARYIKITVWVIALITVWSLGQTYTVTNSLFVFAAAGVIPGTNIALNPNQVLALLASMLAASILLIFGTNIYRGLRRLVMRAHESPVESFAEPKAELEVEPKKTKKAEAPEPQSALVIETPKAPKQPSKASLLLHIANTLVGLLMRNVAEGARKHFPRLAAAFGRAGAAVKRAIAHELQLLGAAFTLFVAAVFHAVRAAARFVAAAVRNAAAFVIAAVRWTVVAIVVVVIQIAHFVTRMSVRFWHWLEPRLRTFDAWLGLHYNRGLSAGRTRVKQSDPYRTGVRSWRRSMRLLAGMRSDLRATLERGSSESEK